MRFEDAFFRVTGFFPERNITRAHEREPLDLGTFELLARMYYEDQRRFSILKKLMSRYENDMSSKVSEIQGYIDYIECRFKSALACFKQTLEYNKDDLAILYCTAFCYRQLGRYTDFDKILMKNG